MRPQGETPAARVDSAWLSAGIQHTFEVPVGTKTVRLTGEFAFHYSVDSEAELPVETVDDGTASAMVLSQITLDATFPHVSVISRYIGLVTAEYFPE